MIAAAVAVTGSALAFVATRRGGDTAVAGERMVIALGDSVAAGQGLGPAMGYPNNPLAFPAIVGGTLGWPVRNHAVSSACAVRAEAEGAHPDTPGACDVSILNDQIPAVPSDATPRLVVVTVGANDIQFAECVVDAIVPELAADGCTPRTLARRLAALEANLDLVAGRLTQRFPGAALVFTSYYNPMPAPAGDDADPCPIFEPLAALRSPLTLASERALREAARTLQANVYAQFRSGVTQLNETIARAALRADATIATVDFAGHDLCRSQTGTGEATWVYGPDYDVRFRVKGAAALLAGGKTWQGTLPSRCPAPTPGEPPEFATGEVERRIGVIEVVYSARVNVNCMPHPTAEGQQAIARAVVAAVPARVR